MDNEQDIRTLWTPSLLLDADFDNEPLDLEYEHLAQRVEEDTRL